MKNKWGEDMKKIKAVEIRRKLHKLQMELNNCIGSNKLTSQYKMKVAYMLLWMRQILVNKDVLKGWKMPDCETILGFAKVGDGK